MNKLSDEIYELERKITFYHAKIIKDLTSEKDEI